MGQCGRQGIWVVQGLNNSMRPSGGGAQPPPPPLRPALQAQPPPNRFPVNGSRNIWPQSTPIPLHAKPSGYFAATRSNMSAPNLLPCQTCCFVCQAACARCASTNITEQANLQQHVHFSYQSTLFTPLIRSKVALAVY